MRAARALSGRDRVRSVRAGAATDGLCAMSGRQAPSRSCTPQPGRVSWDSSGMAQVIAPERVRLGGLAQRPRPSVGGRPAVRFVIAAALTIAYVAFSVHVSTPWRSDLREAIGPVMAWVIPILLAYVPGLLIGFLVFTLLTLRYRVPSPEPPPGPWPDGQWPEVTVVVAAWNEERGIGATLERIASGRLHRPDRGRPGRQQLDRPHRRGRAGDGAATRPGLSAGVRTYARQAPGAQHGSRGRDRLRWS